MKLSSFENEVATRILERGKNYWSLGNVTFLEEVENDTWQASVEGSNSYEIDVSISGGEIMYSACNCPFEGITCKHEVAVYYAILEAEGKAKKKKRTKKLTVRQLVESIEESELQDFIAEYAKKDRQFRTHLTAKFGLQSADPVEIKEHYAKLIYGFFKLYSPDGYIAYNYSSRFSQQLDQVIEQASSFFRKKDYQATLAIVQAFFEEVINMYGETDDSSGVVAESISSMFAFFLHAIENISNEKLKEQIFDYALQEFGKSKYDNYDFSENWQPILLVLIKNAPSRQKQLAEQLAKQVHEMNKHQTSNAFTDYRKQNLLKFKEQVAG